MSSRIVDQRIMVRNIVSSCNILRRQIVRCFTQNCTRDRVPSFIAELRQSVHERIRGRSATSRRHRRAYESTMTSRRNAINLRIFIELLAIQLSLLLNLKEDNTYTNNDRYTMNFLRELRIELHNSEFLLANWRVEYP